MVGRCVPARVRWLAFLVILCCVGGCYTTPVVSRTKYVQRRLENVDVSGLKPAATVEPLRVSWSLPPRWQSLPLTHNPFYTHQQYRSQSHRTATGVAYIRLPLPFSAKTVAWVASREYAKKASDGEIIGQWADDQGREWFEAKNAKYHVKGYVVVHGMQAWIGYWGYRYTEPRKSDEVALATKSLETVIPLP